MQNLRTLHKRAGIGKSVTNALVQISRLSANDSHSEYLTEAVIHHTLHCKHYNNFVKIFLLLTKLWRIRDGCSSEAFMTSLLSIMYIYSTSCEMILFRIEYSKISENFETISSLALKLSRKIFVWNKTPRIRGLKSWIPLQKWYLSMLLFFLRIL